ncbi:MAG TPA: protein phosphatase CheZ [Alphaproteobacteria bacterium]|nr:protein phosphatase CheZ [Alphaproteobacteria bacterium]
MNHDASKNQDLLLSKKVLEDLHRISSFIDSSKKEIFAVPVESLKSKLPTVKGELQSVIDLSAEATHMILTSTESIESLVSQNNNQDKEKLLELVTSIYETCTFQDINGQRIQKVIKVVSIIEDTLVVLIEKLQKELACLGMQTKESTSIQQKEDQLLNGPQSKSEAHDQKAIDDLFSRA